MAASNDGRMFDAPFNVVAGFGSREQAETAARRLTSTGLPAASVEVGSRPDAGGPVETAELRAEMQQELGATWGALSGTQAWGALIGTTLLSVVGLGIGLVLGLVGGFAFAQGTSVILTMIVGGVVGAIGGATAGFVAGGGMAPRVTAGETRSRDFDDPRPLAERDILLAVHATEAETAERAARMLRDDLHADRVDLVDAAGTPLPPQHGHPRPADPEGYWWTRAGEG